MDSYRMLLKKIFKYNYCSGVMNIKCDIWILKFITIEENSFSPWSQTPYLICLVRKVSIISIRRSLSWGCAHSSNSNSPSFSALVWSYKCASTTKVLLLSSQKSRVPQILSRVCWINSLLACFTASLFWDILLIKWI